MLGKKANIGDRICGVFEACLERKSKNICVIFRCKKLDEMHKYIKVKINLTKDVVMTEIYRLQPINNSIFVWNIVISIIKELLHCVVWKPTHRHFN